MWNSSRVSSYFRYSLVLAVLFVCVLAVFPQMLSGNQILTSLVMSASTKQILGWLGVLLVAGTLMVLLESSLSLETYEEDTPDLLSE